VLTPLAELGKRVFFDETLSVTGTQSYASCHAPEVGFSGPNERFNRLGAYEGALHGEFGKPLGAHVKIAVLRYSLYPAPETTDNS